MSNHSQIIICRNENGEIKLDVRFDGDTVWLTQKMIADLFSVSVANINMHLKNIFSEGELTQASTIKEFLIVQKEGSRNISRKTECYNLGVIISIGYRSKPGFKFHAKI